MSIEPALAGHRRPTTWGRKDEEYICDFEMVTKRALDEEEYRLYRYHFILGADWKLCCRKLNVDRGSFFHSVYRIEEKLGRVFRELRPYPLYPLDEYYHGASRWPESASEQWHAENAPKPAPLLSFARRTGPLQFPRPVRKAA